jgi:3-hydroxyisobutyrate dehydrogenase-like beta-hydroxyacid dehydrogenase
MSETVGVIGAGRMGLPIIGHLARKGFRTLATDVDAAKKAQVEARKAQWAAGLHELDGECSVMLVCVGYDHELRELFARMKPRNDAIVAVLSTVHPRTVQELAEEAAARGFHLVDSTVCRGGRAADEGTLLSFVGGPAPVVERLTPVLGAYSTDVVHSGEAGSAQVAKAANNLVLWACLVADHEALALASRYGVDVERLRRALLRSSAANDALEKWGTQTMAWAEDDMAIVAEMAAERGLALPQAGLNREICRALKPRRYKLDQYGS